MSLRKGVEIRSSLHKGFTLVELLVSVSIMVVILGITLSGGPQSIMRLTLADNAYQTELLLREAQLQGSAVNSVGGVYGGVGVFFDRSTSTSVLKFRDKVDPLIKRDIGVGNGLYDQSVSDEKELIFRTTNNHKIGKLCVSEGINPFVCNDEDPTNLIKTLTVSFSRPRQTAHLYVNGEYGVKGDLNKEYTSACIQIDSLKSPAPGFVYSITVYRSGMVTKKASTCK